MRPLCKLFLFVILLPILSEGQNKYQINGVKVVEYGDTLQNAWVGGFNNPVFSPIDLNQDGLMDMFVYDKAAWKALSFINTGNAGHPSYTYAPEYDRMYPSGLSYWAVIRDYNHDGVGDIFTISPQAGTDGIRVYKGYRNGASLDYVETYSELSFTVPPSFHNDIWSFSDNMPVIMDIDGDGAIDIIAPDINAVNLDWCRNVAIDSGYSADSLVFVLQTGCWGQFAEDINDCNVQLGISCKKELIDSGARDLRHQGGACWGTHYVRNSNVTSVFVADIYCNTTKFLWNTGDTHNADVTYVDTVFPHYDVPVDMPLFPAVYGMDVDNDGFEDLLVAPFASNGDVPSQSIDVNVVHYYHNNAGTDTVNTYHYEGDTLLNDGIVDVGTESHPVFFDYNGDGLMDIVIGGYGRFSGIGPSGDGSGLPGISVSSLALFQNIGTDTMPVFQLMDTDWNHLSAYNLTGLYPAFGDLNGDGLPDMVVGDLNGNINLFINQGTASQASYPVMDSAHWFGINVGSDATPFIYDVNGDGLNDLVIGSSGRSPSVLGANIFYYWNFGTATHPKFSPDSVNNFFGDILVRDTSISGVVPGFSNPVIHSENGTLMLYTGCARGLTFKFAINPDSLRGGAFDVTSTNVLGVSPGLRSTVSIADINHDGYNEYLTGNVRGGMMLFSDVPWSSSSTDGIATTTATTGQMEVFPNPAKDKVVCRLTDSDQRLMSAVLYDMLGELIAVPVSNQGPNTLVISVAGIPNGIYVVQTRDAAGQVYQKKITIFS